MNKVLLLSFLLFFAITGMAQNVGIGTINPLSPLHVSSNSSNVLLIENKQFLNTDTTTALYFKTGNGQLPYTGGIKTIGQNSAESRLALFTYSSAISSGLRERLSILDNGNVGIGTINPVAKLEVAGEIKISGGTPGVGKVLTSDATGLASWQTANVAVAASNYPIVGMGCQTWMAKNLDVATYRNGDPIPKVTDATAWAALTTGAYCYYNNDSATYAATYGKLYNWYAVNDARGLAPAGWHVPTDYEWTILINGLGGTAQGGDLKEIGTSHWTTPNTNATNISGFAGLPGGERFSSGTFGDNGKYGGWLVATETNTAFAWTRFLSFNSGSLDRNGAFTKQGGFSVRCLRD
jgi:uncharacterized protein (TIGR02145 family)